MVNRTITFSFLMLAWIPASSRGEDKVFVRVVDVGAGHCAVVTIPGNHFMVYDAGYYQGDGERHTIASIRELIPDDSTIDLLVLSHSDSDHLGVVDEICTGYKVKRVIRSGYVRNRVTWRDSNTAIGLEKENEGCLDINLRHSELPPGATYRFGDVFVTMVSGFHKPPSSWDVAGTSEERNAGSIVIRLQYANRSVLFTGDVVGRHINDSADTCIAAEKFMVDNASIIKIDSDVLIAPHHGADNGSSSLFIHAVSPEFVIFPAGSHYDHPRWTTVQRYLAHGIPVAKMFRTDLGDDESGGDADDEWQHGRIPGHKDKPGDDDVDTVITKSGALTVAYRNPH